MLKKLLSVTFTAVVVSAGVLLVGGCKSDTNTSTASSPYGLTGSTETRQPSYSHVNSKGTYQSAWQ